MPDASEPSFLGYAGTYQERETRRTCFDNDIDAGDLCSALTMAPPCPSRVACEALQVGRSDPRQACGSDAAERNTRCGGSLAPLASRGRERGQSACGRVRSTMAERSDAAAAFSQDERDIVRTFHGGNIVSESYQNGGRRHIESRDMSRIGNRGMARCEIGCRGRWFIWRSRSNILINHGSEGSVRAYAKLRWSCPADQIQRGDQAAGGLLEHCRKN